MNKQGPLTDPVALAAANRFYDDIIAWADPGVALPELRPVTEAYRAQTLEDPCLMQQLNDMRGFLTGLMVAGALSIEQADDLKTRLDKGHDTRWLR